MNIENEKTESLLAVKLLGIEIDDKLNFNNLITTNCRSAANQLNALISWRCFLGIEERKALIQSLYYQISITVHLCACYPVLNL